MKYASKIIIVILIVISIVFQGCWDKVEIDRKTYISSIGIDVSNEDSVNSQIAIAESQLLKKNDRTKIKVIYGIPNLGFQEGNIGTPEEETITMNVYSLGDALAEGNAKSSRTIRGDYVKMILFSKDVLRYSETIKEMADYISKHPLFSRTMSIVCCDSNSEDIIKFRPKTEKSVENYIKGIIENSERKGSVFNTNLNEFLTGLGENNNVIIPNIKLDKENQEIILAGMAILKDYKFVGELDPEEIYFIQMMKGELKGGNKLLVYNGYPLDIFADNSKRHISVNETNNNLNVNVDVELEALIKGHQIDQDLFEDDQLFNIEQSFNKKLKIQCNRIINVCQKEYEVDLIGISEYIKKYKPNLWDKIKDNWEEVYKTANINVNVTSKIRRIGVEK